MEKTNNLIEKINQSAALIKKSTRITAFTGAGISVESGIPPFRGDGGLWNKYNPEFLDISYFINNPKKSWKKIKEIFYDFFGKAKPNGAHYALAEMEKYEFLHSIITQNIDNLHQQAGSKKIYEFHGNSRDLICIDCNHKISVNNIDLNILPPKCNLCGGLLKPDFVFFGEPIPEPASTESFNESEISDIFILIGTSGEIMPASIIPHKAKSNGIKIIEINIIPSNYTNSITDIFLQGKATEIMKILIKRLKK